MSPYRRVCASRSRSTSTACVRSSAAIIRIADGRLVFSRELVKEDRLGFWRWFLGAWGIGTYRRNDQVDVAWDLDGHPQVAHALDIEHSTPKTGS